MTNMRKYLVATVFALLPAVALSGEPPPITASEFSGAALKAAAPVAGWFWTFLAAPEVGAVVLVVISTAAGALVRHHWIVKWRLGRAVQCLAAGVRETYEEYVRVVQKSHADGKLTVEERDQAMRMALEKGMAYARKQGFDLAKTYAKEFLPVIVERLIGIQKASGRGFPLEPPLPELEPR